jgi:hypothetical protein
MYFCTFLDPGNNKNVDRVALTNNHPVPRPVPLQRVSAAYPTGSSFIDSFTSGIHITGTLRDEREEERNAAAADLDTNTYGTSLPKIVRLIQRFHLAMFFLNGRYPTMLHRLFRIQYRQSPSPHPQFTPMYPSYNIVALIILLQCLSDAGQVTGYASLMSWRQAGSLLQSWKKRIFYRHSSPPPPPKSFLELLEERVPSMASAVANGEYASLPPRGDAPTCMVCRNPRGSPAGASPGCGHIFCWGCALAWTSKKPECPSCRTPCPPQAVLAIYNY